MKNIDKENKTFRPIVRCNNCGNLLFEAHIVYDGDEDKEFCPRCGEAGYLMDIKENEMDDVAFTHLSHHKDFEKLKAKLNLEHLIDIQNKLVKYEVTHDKGYFKGNFVIQWYEGLIDTDALIKIYKGERL